MFTERPNTQKDNDQNICKNGTLAYNLCSNEFNKPNLTSSAGDTKWSKLGQLLPASLTFALTFNLGPIRESQIFYPNQSHRLPCWLAHLQLPQQTTSNQSLCEVFPLFTMKSPHSLASLWVSANWKWWGRTPLQALNTFPLLSLIWVVFVYFHIT